MPAHTPRPGLTRRRLVGSALAGAALMQLPLGARGLTRTARAQETGSAAAPGWSTADYMAFADRMSLLLDDRWSRSRSAYTGGQGADTSMNGNLLYMHAAAALLGHDGPARQDDRARALAARLCESPPFRTAPPPQQTGQPVARASADQTHDYGWGNGMTTVAHQHVVIDTEVVRGLAEAWRARDVLALAPETVLLIQDRINACATSPFMRYPALRLSQINWPVEIYVDAAEVTGNVDLLHHDTRAQFERFARGIRTPAPGQVVSFLGPGYRFHYLPQYGVHHPNNVDSAEYANIVCSGLAVYDRAIEMGMAPLPVEHIRLLRAWAERVLSGYWTHAGYLNWDTGMGFKRWHEGKKHGLSQRALLALAMTPRFRGTPEHSAWAKHLFDRSFELVDMWADRENGLPPAVPFGITATEGEVGDSRLWAARAGANAAAAARRGLGRRPAKRPPALYAYDPDTGRLAVTTPRYNTVVMVVNQDAFPYGGIELARLHDGRQDVAASTGGQGSSAFGVAVRDHRRRRTYHSQTPRRFRNLKNPPLRLTRAPWGSTRHPEPYPRHPYAGPFEVVEAVGRASTPLLRIRTRHRFRSESIETRWDLTPRRAKGTCTADVQFPSWGDGAKVFAVLVDGTRVEMSETPVALAAVAWFDVAGERSGYVIVPRGAPPAATARLRPARPKRANPHPGPTLTIRVIDAARPRRTRFVAALAVVDGPDDAARMAARLLRR